LLEKRILQVRARAHGDTAGAPHAVALSQNGILLDPTPCLLSFDYLNPAINITEQA
jgi:hypothetical protein